ncbi:MAG TPA: hypothetical protein VJK28_01160, partial [Nitrospiria bacterium]|nr:hypothetical protein [Nitrospiria bacterium]
MILKAKNLHTTIRYRFGRYGIPLLLLIGACAHQERFYYTPDPNQLKEVETKVREGSIETPTLGDPVIALTNHEAFMLSYYGEKGEIIDAAVHRLADLYLILENR